MARPSHRIVRPCRAQGGTHARYYRMGLVAEEAHDAHSARMVGPGGPRRGKDEPIVQGRGPDEPHAGVRASAGGRRGPIRRQ